MQSAICLVQSRLSAAVSSRVLKVLGGFISHNLHLSRKQYRICSCYMSCSQSFDFTLSNVTCCLLEKLWNYWPRALTAPSGIPVVQLLRLQIFKVSKSSPNCHASTFTLAMNWRYPTLYFFLICSDHVSLSFLMMLLFQHKFQDS